MIRQQRGFSLLEVAIAMGVLAVGLSGLCALLIKSTAGTGSVSDRTKAAWLADRLESEFALTPPDTWMAPSVNPPRSSCVPASPCLPPAFAATSLAQWKDSVSRTLPHGTGTLCLDSTPTDGQPQDWACDGEGGPVIKVAWRTVGQPESWASLHREMRR